MTPDPTRCARFKRALVLPQLHADRDATPRTRAPPRRRSPSTKLSPREDRAQRLARARAVRSRRRRPRLSPTSRRRSGAWWRKVAVRLWTCTTVLTWTPQRTGARFPRRRDEDHARGRDDPAARAAGTSLEPQQPPRLGGDREHCSLLRQVKDHIPGVLVPWRVGSTFSSFCWHFEDHMLYSPITTHVGADVTWYGVPGSSADAVEECFKRDARSVRRAARRPAAARDDAQPAVAVNDGRRLADGARRDQRAGEFVVTFPRSYHAGFNTGPNCARRSTSRAALGCASAWRGWSAIGFTASRTVLCHDELLCVPPPRRRRRRGGALARRRPQATRATRSAPRGNAHGGRRRSRGRYAPKRLAAAAPRGPAGPPREPLSSQRAAETAMTKPSATPRARPRRRWSRRSARRSAESRRAARERERRVRSRAVPSAGISCRARRAA